MFLSMSSILAASGLTGLAPRATGRPVYHPLLLLKLYIYGYLNRVQSSRRLEREAGRNVEVIQPMILPFKNLSISFTSPSFCRAKNRLHRGHRR